MPGIGHRLESHAHPDQALWPLTGREAQLGQFVHGLNSGRLKGAVIAGGTGVGKSRFLAECLSLSQQSGAATTSILATRAMATVPFSAFGGLMASSVAAPVRKGEEADPFNLLRHVTTVLRRQAGGRRLVLGVDNAHLLDAGSITLLVSLVASGVAFVVLTTDPAEQTTTQDGITALWRDGLALRVELTPLTRPVVGDLLGVVLGGRVEEDTVALLHEWSAGIPLYLVELADAAREQGRLRELRGIWRYRGAPLSMEWTLAPTSRLRDIITLRLQSRVSGGQQWRALELLALAESVPLSVLRPLLDDGQLEEWERLGVITAEFDHAEEYFRFSHPLTRQVIRERIPPGHRRRLARTLVGAIPAWRCGRPLPVAVLHDAAEVAAPPELLVAAARVSLRRGDGDSAERFARTALTAGGGVPAVLVLADAYESLDRYQDAATLLEEELVRGRDVPARRLLARYLRLLCSRLGQAEEAHSLLTRAAAWSSEEAWHRWLESCRARLWFEQGQFAEAISAAASVAEDPGAESHARRHARFVAGISLVQIGDVPRAVALTSLDGAPGREHTERVEQPRETAARLAEVTIVEAAGWVAVQAWTGLNWPRLAETLTEFRAAARRARRRSHLDLADLAAAAVAAEQGLVGRAVDLLQQCLLRWDESDPWGVTPCGLALLARAAAQLGDNTTVERAHEQLTKLIVSGNHMHGWYTAYQVSLAEIWVAASRGESSRARVMALAAAAASESTLARATFLHEALRLGARASDVVRPLAGVATVDASPLVQAYAAHAAALLEPDASQLEAVSRRFEELGALLLAAEAAAAAAWAHQRAGWPLRAQAATSKGYALLQECGGATTPGVAALLVPSVKVLTPREHEVTWLAVRGLSNTEIAERLVLSTRTVESHLYRAFAKLGVHDRSELGELLNQAPGPSPAYPDGGLSSRLDKLA
jgi:DNA-binding NarL/FixJ family response regulator